VWGIFTGLIFTKDSGLENLEFLRENENQCWNFVIGNLSLYVLIIIYYIIAYFVITIRNVKIMMYVDNILTIMTVIWGFVGIEFCWSDSMI